MTPLTVHRSWKTSVSLGMLLSCLIFAGCSADPRDLLEDGKGYLAAGKVSEAVILLKKALAAAPELAEGHYHLGLAYLALAEIDGAAGEFSETIALEDAHVEARLRYGTLLLFRREYESARAQAEAVLLRAPDRVEAHILLGNSYARLIHLNDSIHEVREAIEAGARPLPSFIDLDPEAESAADLRKAEEAYEAAAAVDRGRIPAQIALGNLKLNLKRFADAERQFDAASAAEPGSRDVLRAIAYLRVRTGEFAEAESLYRKLADSDPDDVPQRIALADFYGSLERHDRAVEVLEEILRQSPENRVARRRLTEAFLAEERLDDAAGNVDAILESNEDDAEALLTKGRILLAQQKPAEAAAELRKALDNEPQLALGRYFLGLAYTQAGDLQKAEDEFRTILEDMVARNDADPAAHVVKGRMLAGENRMADAVAEFRRAVDLDPTSKEAHYFLGMAYRQDGKPHLAEESWNAALKLDRRFVQAHIALAEAKLADGKPTEAINHAREGLRVSNQGEALLVLGNAQLAKGERLAAAATFRRLVQQQPENALARGRLAFALIAGGEFAEAETHLDAGLRLDPKNVDIVAQLANVYLQQKNAGKAIRLISEYSTRYPDDSKAHKIAGQIHFSQKDYKKAEDAYRRALTMNANDIEAYSMLGQLFVAQNAYDRGISEFEKALALDPSSVNTHIVLGMLHEMRNNGTRAQVHYRKALSLDSNSAVAANNLAWLLAESEQELEEAGRLAQLALERLPGTPAAMDTKGWVHYKKGEFDAAASLFRESLKLAPGNVTYQYHLGMSYYRLGNRESAEPLLREVIRRNPTFHARAEIEAALASLARG